MSERPIGTCSKCGGPVVMPSMMVNPVPHCKNCGARIAKPYGRVIEMEPTDIPSHEAPKSSLKGSIS